jgi:hypothetical protein
MDSKTARCEFAVLFPLNIAGGALMALSLFYLGFLDALESNALVALSRAIPSVEKFVRLSEFPELTRLMILLTWTMVPVNALLLLRHPSTAIRAVTNGGANITLVSVQTTMFWGMIALCWIWFPMRPTLLEEGTTASRIARLVSTSPMGLGAVCGFISSFLGFGLVWPLAVWSRLRESRSSRHIGKGR